MAVTMAITYRVSSNSMAGLESRKSLTILCDTTTMQIYKTMPDVTGK